MGVPLARKAVFCLGMTFFGLMAMLALGPTQWVRCKNRSMKSLTGRFMPKKRHFWSRNVNYPRFFGLFLDVLGYVLEFLRWTLQKTGSKPNLVVGGSLHVIESIS